MTQKPTPEGVNHFVGEVHKAHTPDDVLERRKKIDKALNDIIHAGYEEADSSRACESGAQSFDGIWWVQKFGCDSLQSCMDECEAVLFEVRIATNLLARINELEQTLNNERAVGRQKMVEDKCRTCGYDNHTRCEMCLREDGCPPWVDKRKMT